MNTCNNYSVKQGWMIILSLFVVTFFAPLSAKQDTKKKVTVCKYTEQGVLISCSTGWYDDEVNPCKDMDYYWINENGDRQKFESSQLKCTTWPINHQDHGDNVEVVGDISVYSTSNKQISITCPDGTKADVYDYSNFVPAHWTAFHTALVPNERGDIILEIYNIDSESDVAPFYNLGSVIKVLIPAHLFQMPCVASVPDFVQEDLDTAKIVSAPTIVWSISPNPSNGQAVVIAIDNPALLTIKPQIDIYSPTGQFLRSMIAETKKLEINKADLAEGLYYISISNGLELVTKKLVISN